MKKLDILTICLIILISSLMLGTYISKNNVDKSNLIVQINFKDKEIYEIDPNKSSYVIKVTSNSKKDELYLKIMDNAYNILNNKTIKVSIDHDVEYVINIQKEKVFLTEATCEHKYCLKMRLTPSFTTPIICTDGLIVKYKSTEINIIV